MTVLYHQEKNIYPIDSPVQNRYCDGFGPVHGYLHVGYTATPNRVEQGKSGEIM